jgi:hypothetical protein
LCEAWWEEEESRPKMLIDPPEIEVRLSITLYALSQHRSILPEGLEDWLENRIVRALEEHGEEVAGLILASFTDENLHQISWLSQGGDA